MNKRYRHRKQVEAFDDSLNADEWQKEVYRKARNIFDKYNLKNVVDVGCGSAYKLLHYFKGSAIGIESGKILSFLKATYPDQKWLDFNETDFNELSADLLICADVIEHVKDPGEFLSLLKTVNRVQYYVFSTPERTLINNSRKYGPPNNVHHYREWTFHEFRDFISDYFEVIEHYISNESQGTQCIIAKSR